MMTPVVVAIAAASAVALIIQYLSSRQKRRADQAISHRHGCLPTPRLKNHRPFGIDRLEQIFRADSESRMMEQFMSYFRQMGNTLNYKLLGMTTYATIEPANLEAMLSTSFQEFGLGPRRAILYPVFGDGVFTQEGADWKNSRDMLRPQLQHKHYDDLQIFQDAANDLIQLIRGSDRIVDLQPLFFRLALDTTTAFLFGESTRSLLSPEIVGERNFANAFNSAQRWVVERYRFQDLYWMIDGRGFRRAGRDVREFADKIIDRNLPPNRCRTDGEGKQVFLDAVEQRTSDRAALRGQIINLLVAGRDTTACFLSWTFFLLVRHPNVMKKLRKEISSTCDANSKLNRESLRKMQYLQNVLKETLRLYPSVPVNIRMATRTTVLPTGGGPDGHSPVLIPNGSPVAFSVYAMHRRPDLFGMDAELFRPERWDEDMPLQHDPTSAKWGYLPFHGGPRTCLGMDFALTEAGYIVVRLLQSFANIKLPDREAVELVGVEEQVATLFISIKDGCRVEISQ